MNLYGFKCISRGEDKGAFFHTKFRRGEWEVVKRITRYAPLKRAAESLLGENKPEGQIADNSVAITEPTDSHFHHAASGFAPYNGPMHGFSSYDPFLAHADASQGGLYTPNSHWHWSMLHSTPVYAHNFTQIKQNSVMEANTASCYHGQHFQQPQQAYVTAVPLTQSTSLVHHSSASSLKPEMFLQANSIATTRNESAKSFINVVNQVVTIDPYFDLGDDFALFQGDDFRDETTTHAAPKMESSVAKMREEVPRPADQMKMEQSQFSQQPGFAEMGVNTDITMEFFEDFYQACNDV